jgi:hypothetical protein
MISETEKQKLRLLEEYVHRVTKAMMVELGVDESTTPEELGGETQEALQARAAGTQLATLDALFAIREGEPWRGITDPREIARELLVVSGMGDGPEES